MSNSKSFKRYPAVHCWIKHIKEGIYNDNKKLFYTIFGRAKRIRIIATIISKKEKLTELKENNFEETTDINTNIGLDFDLDDGTGLIRGFIRNINPEKYNKFNPGDVVDIVGRVTKWQDFISLWIEIIKRVDHPNFILLRNAEIIKKIKSGEIHEIAAPIPDSKDFSNDLNIDNLFEENNSFSEIETKKEHVYSIIKNYSVDGNGINFEKIKKETNIADIELRTYLNELILEMRIYESDDNVYESY